MKNSQHKPPSYPGHKKAVLGMVLVFFVVLLISNLFLVNKQKRALEEAAAAQIQFELEEAAAFMIEPLLRYQFSDVNQFIQNWSESHKDVLEFQAISPTGHLLSSFSRQPDTPVRQTTAKQEITYAGKPLLTLSLTKDLSDIERLVHASRNLHLWASILIVSIIGMVLWLVFKTFALRPLELDIVEHLKAEEELDEINLFLEDRVRERTSELYSKNAQLEEEIRQREKFQHLLSTEKERLLVTLRSIGEGVITTDTTGSVVLLNKVAESMTGWSQQDAAGRRLEEVFHIINEQTREPCESPVDKVIKTGQVVGLANHTALIDKDGNERSIADSGAPIRDSQSEIIGVVLVFRDISEHLRTEKELLKVKKLESVGVLAGGIAHDFNNILTAILGNINLALFDPELKDKTKGFLTEAEKASLRAKDLTQQLLTFAKGGEPVTEMSSLEDVIKDSANFVLRGDKVSCSYDIPEGLWLVDIDKGQISQVIQNIVLNASHAMPEGGTIKVSCNNLSTADKDLLPFIIEGKFVKIDIQDKGIGMPANVVEKIFDPYFSTKQEGSGLGLAISQSIIHRHNGHMSVKSSPGVGTTFTIYLPASIKTKTQQPKQVIAGKALLQAKILLMDDDEAVKSVAKGMLNEMGHEAVLASDGREALELYQESIDTGEKIDMVIMDLTIPGGMGGKETVQEILKIDPTARVIVSSGYSNDPILANFEDYGFCGAIIKPFRLQELSKEISRVIDHNLSES